MNAKRLGVALLLDFSTSFVFAVFSMRLPVLWVLMPASLNDAMIISFNIKTQEEASEFEFFLAWLLSFLLFLFITATALVVRKWSKRLRQGD
jgi:uncharacterized membrane protein YphA (DoxX/SURF4 family)